MTKKNVFSNASAKYNVIDQTLYKNLHKKLGKKINDPLLKKKRLKQICRNNFNRQILFL